MDSLQCSFKLLAYNSVTEHVTLGAKFATLNLWGAVAISLSDNRCCHQSPAGIMLWHVKSETKITKFSSNSTLVLQEDVEANTYRKSSVTLLLERNITTKSYDLRLGGLVVDLLHADMLVHSRYLSELHLAAPIGVAPETRGCGN